MSSFFGYIRVSTAKQGTRGVSLTEQRDAIEQYATRHELTITRWFEEHETAARAGRPVFAEMLKLLRRGVARGVVIHKIDRSSRNFRDWADIGDLVDGGIDVRFANEALDLHSRGGRIAADMLAVVAADYVRNLREETKKGMRGRLKQGLYPMPAPVGYRDCGGGKPKAIDPATGPMVQAAFDLYRTGNYSITALRDELHRRGLRTRNGGRLSRNGVAKMLHNPFYVGLIRVRTTGELFEGAHEPLLSKALFDQVQTISSGRTIPRVQRHDFLFRRLLTCRCGSTLTGELQKGHVYYRCHTRDCPTKGVREDLVNARVRSCLAPLGMDGEDRAYVEGIVAEHREQWFEGRHRRHRDLELKIERVTTRLGRLTDAYVDGTVESDLFQERKNALVSERVDLQSRLKLGADVDPGHYVMEFFELAENANVRYELGTPAEKREILRNVTSNRTVDRKSIDIMLREPFETIAKQQHGSSGSPRRYRLRTLDRLIDHIWQVARSGGLTFLQEDNKLTEKGKGVDVAA